MENFLKLLDRKFKANKAECPEMQCPTPPKNHFHLITFTSPMGSAFIKKTPRSARTISKSNCLIQDYQASVERY